MSQHHVVFLPGNITIKADHNTTLKEAIKEAGLSLDFPCGGMGTCGKCRIRVVDGSDTPKEQEAALLSANDMERGIRLACLTDVSGHMTVELLKNEKPQHQILLSSLDRIALVDPHLNKQYVEMEKPTMTDSRPDWQRVRESLAQLDIRNVHAKAHLNVLRTLPTMLRSSKYQVTAVLHDQEIRSLEAGDSTDTLLGMAFDIGTTTIVGYLMDLYTGRELSVASMLNPQTQFGADVISRITHHIQNENGLEELHAAVTGAVNTLIGEATGKAGVSRNDVYAISVVGNTCMHHLFLGITPRQVALAPYVAAVSEPVVVDPADVRLAINPAGKVFVLSNIAGFVGADTVAVLLATEMDQSETVKLIIDIGTNGEIALGSKDRLAACSAAAGPAFEGAQISCGMRGATGAIDHVTFSEELAVTVIGNVEPQGICGSALLDTVAGLLENGLINEKGKFNDPSEVTNPVGLQLTKHLVKHNGLWAFMLTEESAAQPVMVTQKDIRELQLAKGAMAAGIRILMKTCGITVNDIQEVLLAGAFGNYLNSHSACVIGLIPQELEGKIRMIGNAAGAGAKLALLSNKEYVRAAEIAKRVEFVELGSNREFTTIFAESMLFPKYNNAERRVVLEW